MTEDEKIAFRMMKQETGNPIFTVSDPELIKSLKFTPGKFYCYYKPSYLNGYAQY